MPQGRTDARPLVSLNYPGHPVHVQLAVEHDGAALRRPAGLRLRRPVRQARARRRAARHASRRLDRQTASTLRRDLNAGGSKFCGDCPLKLPLKKDRQRRQSRSDVAPLPSRLYIECTAACNISCEQACCAPETGITRTRQAGMLDFEVFKRVVDEAGPVAGPHRLLQLRRGVPPQARRGDVRVHQGRTSRTSISTRAPTAWPSPRSRSRRLVRSGIDEVTFSIDGATPESYAKYRQRGDFDKAIREPARRGGREARSRPRRAVHQLALHPLQPQRQRAGDAAGPARWPTRSASIASAGS